MGRRSDADFVKRGGRTSTSLAEEGRRDWESRPRPRLSRDWSKSFSDEQYRNHTYGRGSGFRGLARRRERKDERIQHK